MEKTDNRKDYINRKEHKNMKKSFKEFEVIVGEVTQDNFDNMNSITFIKLIARLEKEFDMEFEDDMLLIKSFPNTEALYQYVSDKSQQSKE